MDTIWLRLVFWGENKGWRFGDRGQLKRQQISTTSITFWGTCHQDPDRGGVRSPKARMLEWRHLTSYFRLFTVGKKTLRTPLNEFVFQNECATCRNTIIPRNLLWHSKKISVCHDLLSIAAVQSRRDTRDHLTYPLSNAESVFMAKTKPFRGWICLFVRFSVCFFTCFEKSCRLVRSGSRVCLRVHRGSDVFNPRRGWHFEGPIRCVFESHVTDFFFQPETQLTLWIIITSASKVFNNSRVFPPLPFLYM